MKMKKYLKLILCLLVVFTLTGCELTLFSSTNGKTIDINYEGGIAKVENNFYYTELSTDFEYNLTDYESYFTENYVNSAVVDYIKKSQSSYTGLCSGARSGNYVGRTYDWYYQDAPLLMVKTEGNDSRLASYGVTQGFIDKASIESGEVDDKRKLVVVDGLNEAGVSIQINVLPIGYEINDGTKGTGSKVLNSLLVCRFVLDNAHSVDEAIEMLKDYRIEGTYNKDMIEEYHWFLSDSTKSVVLEVVDGNMVVVEDNVMTNFYLNSKYFDNTSTKEVGVESLKKLQPMAMGWRRYYILKDEIKTEASSVKSMFNKMTKVYYSQYTDSTKEDPWYDEYYGTYEKYGIYDYNLNKENEENNAKIREIMKTITPKTTYNDGTWYTGHLTVFDFKNKTMTVAVDEQDFSHAYTVKFEK